MSAFLKLSKRLKRIQIWQISVPRPSLFIWSNQYRIQSVRHNSLDHNGIPTVSFIITMALGTVTNSNGPLSFAIKIVFGVFHVKSQTDPS